MQSKAKTPAQYVSEVPEHQLKAFKKIRTLLRKHLPVGFKEVMNYGMLGYVVPHSLYPAGYHCSPELPLPFMNLASQKNFIGVYHMGLYSDKKLLQWFQKKYAAQTSHKLDMGKSCIRFKKMDDIPYGLLGELAGKITVKQWVQVYEKAWKKA